MSVLTSVFIIPTVVGLALALFSFLMFKRAKISPRYFGLSLLVSLTLVLSFAIYAVITAVRDFFGIVYTFVFLFGLAIVGIIGLLVYIVVLIGSLKKEISEIWQEIALMEDGEHINPADDD